MIESMSARPPGPQMQIPAPPNLPAEVRMQEKREATKLRYVLRRRRNPPNTLYRRLYTWATPHVDFLMTGLCLQLPLVFRDRHRRLFYSVMEPNTWPHMFDDPDARYRATHAWQTYIQGLLSEWTNMNVVTALVLSASVSFLDLPGLPQVSTYCMFIAIACSLTSITHATYYLQYYRSLLDDKNYTLIQLRAFCSCYHKVIAYYLCLPLLNLLYALAGFSIGTIAYLWPSPESDAPTAAPFTGKFIAKLIIPVVFLFQLGLIPASYKWNRSAFFTTNELLPAEEYRLAQVHEWEDRMADEQLQWITHQEKVARNIPVLEYGSNGQLLRPTSPERKFSEESNGIHSHDLDPQPPTNLPANDEARCQWVKSQMAGIPANAVPLGYEGSSYPSILYAARVFFKGSEHCGKAGSHLMGGGSIAWQGREVACSTYDVLCGDPLSFAWVHIPKGTSFHSKAAAPPGWEFVRGDSGGSGDGNGDEPVYIASIEYDGGLHIGKVQDGDTESRVPWGGKEIRLSPFRVLLVRDSTKE